MRLSGTEPTGGTADVEADVVKLPSLQLKLLQRNSTRNVG